MVLAEAMAARLAVIAAASGAIPEVVRGAAPIFAPGDWTELARQLASGPLARPPGERVAYPADLLETHSGAAYAERLASAYESRPRPRRRRNAVATILHRSCQATPTPPRSPVLRAASAAALRPLGLDEGSDGCTTRPRRGMSFAIRRHTAERQLSGRSCAARVHDDRLRRARTLNRVARICERKASPATSWTAGPSTVARRS